MDTANKYCRILFDILEKKGVKDVICSPGSRNVPLLLAAASREGLKKHFVVDEREAGFLGLGISMVSRKPVALVCTSGTALLNYAPAVAEAYYQGVPLIVISADRPLQWIDQDDSQTIRQDGAFSNFVKKSYSIPAYSGESSELEWYVDRLVNDALMKSREGKPGPVHINIHIGEPLGLKCRRDNADPRIITMISADTLANKETLKDLANELSGAKVLLVAGFMAPDSSLQKAVTEFSRFPNVVVMAETISNLHLNPEVHAIDSVLTAYDEKILDGVAPDIVISLGGALVSRKLKEYLRRNSKRCRHWAVGFAYFTSDPFMSLERRIQLDPTRFFKGINSALRKIGIQNDFSSTWKSLRLKALQAKNNFIRDCGWSELKAFEIILKNIHGDINLYLSNGTPIRYAQLIEYKLPHASYCNRGVSGIDGTTVTAIGGAIAYKGASLLITGDLSLAYDLGALNLKETPRNFKIVVIDNQGGGIFRFIPSTSDLPECEEYLCQNPEIPLKELAEAFDWNYFECNDEASLQKVYPKFLSHTSKSILKVSCPGLSGASLLKAYMALKAF